MAPRPLHLPPRCIEGSAGRHWLGFYERLLVQNPPGTFVAGTKEPSHADYLLFDLLDSVRDNTSRDACELPFPLGPGGYAPSCAADTTACCALAVPLAHTQPALRTGLMAPAWRLLHVSRRVILVLT